MKTEIRRSLILKELVERNAHYSALTEKFNVSEATIRRDLQWLADNKGVTRTYGGAVLVGDGEVSVAQRSRAQREQKLAIGRVAAASIQPGDCVLLDSGTTTGALARALKDRSGITVVTNGLNAIQELADTEVELVVLGGSFRSINQALVGSITEDNLTRFRFDWAFLGANSIDATDGIGCVSVAQAFLKEHMAARGNKVAVLADATKLGMTKGQYRAALKERFTLITDSGASAGECERFAAVADLQIADLHGEADSPSSGLEK